MFSKFFVNAGPLSHHIYYRDEHAKRVGADGKPEIYFFPSQLNLHAPASLCTYVPQFTSDVYAMYQSVLYGGHTVI